jgi:sarcosine oxidase subunit delta
MLIIECPWCGPRAESEFAYGGEGGIARPLATESMTDEQWGDYVFMRKNPKGLHHEQWRHASGCGKWFNALRDTVSYRFQGTWKIGAEPPAAFSRLGAAGAGPAGAAVTPVSSGANATADGAAR